jgi:hypothetical protein
VIQILDGIVGSTCRPLGLLEMSRTPAVRTLSRWFSGIIATEFSGSPDQRLREISAAISSLIGLSDREVSLNEFSGTEPNEIKHLNWWRRGELNPRPKTFRP